jgi:hypothetical protein
LFYDITTTSTIMFFRSTIVAAAAIFATANAHVIMKSPVPYSVDKIDNSPITKAQFPCKAQNGFSISKMNQMKVGEKNTVELSGSAVHGGGSCQLSVSLDMEPTASSVFKVIKSMEGGCPGVDSAAGSYDFELPDGIPNGNATFAWTWMSKLAGQAELYMNCAPIEVSGGASDKSKFDALPDMLVINIDDTCKSVPNFAVQFPNPGTVVEKGATNDAKAPTGSGCGSSSGTTPADPSSPAGEPSAAPTSAANDGQYSAAPTSAAPASSAPPSNGGVFAPGASSAPAVTSSAAADVPSAAPNASTSTTLVTVTGTPSAPSATVPAGTGSPAAPTSAPSTPSAGGSTGTCTENGKVVCNGTTQFGLCNNGEVVWQAVAAGTTCVNGSVTKRGYNGRIARPRWSSHRVVIPGRD